MRSLLCLTLAVMSAGCALRPRYAEVMRGVAVDGPVKETKLLLTTTSGAPLPNVRVEFGEWKNKVSVKTEADGTCVVPYAERYLKDNAVFVVTLPAGVEGYRLAVAPRAEVPAPVVPAEVVPAPTPEATPTPAPSPAPSTEAKP